MGAAFHIIGSNQTPKVNGTGGPGWAFRTANASPPTISANGSAIGGQVINLSQNAYTAYSYSYNGVGNWPSTKPFTLVMRAAIIGMADGFTRALFYCGAGGQPDPDSFAAWITPTDIVVRQKNWAGQVGINSVTFAHGGITDGTFYDFGFTFTGDASTNGCKVYLGNSLLGQTTSSRTWDNPLIAPPTDRIGEHRDLQIGYAGNNVNNTRFLLNEFYLDDTIWDLTANVTTDSGSEALGTSRTGFIATTAYDGSASAGGDCGCLIRI